MLTNTRKAVLVPNGVRVYNVAIPRDDTFYYGFLLLVKIFNSNSNHCTSERGVHGDDHTSLVITGDGNHQ
jgi:hypothetical protein